MKNDSDSPARTQQPPAASPMVRWITILIGLVLLALAGLAGFEIWAKQTGHASRSVVAPFMNRIANLHYENWMFYAGILSCLIALLLLFFVFKPRAKTHRALADPNSSIWMRPVDIARMLSARAEKVPGVSHAATKVGKRSIGMAITGASKDPTLGERVSQAVGPLAAQLDEDTKVDINITESKEGNL